MFRTGAGPCVSAQLSLGGFFSTPGNHLAGWRHPDAVPTADMDFRMYAHITQVVEAAKFDTIFFQDTAAVNGSRALARGDMTRTASAGSSSWNRPHCSARWRR